jgi:hypothetical protein
MVEMKIGRSVMPNRLAEDATTSLKVFRLKSVCSAMPPVKHGGYYFPHLLQIPACKRRLVKIEAES